MRWTVAALSPLLAAACVGCQVGFVAVDGGLGLGDPADAPVLDELAFEPDYEKWHLRAQFAWSDPQSNVREGALKVFVDGSVTATYDLPDNAVVLFSDVGEVKTDLSPFATNQVVQIGLVLVDTDGNESAALEGPVDLGRTFYFEQEPNDTAQQPQNLGGIERPAAIVGDLTLLTDGGEGGYGGDLDYYRFAPITGGTFTFTLYWPTKDNDLGMFLLEGNGTFKSGADEYSLYPPETMSSPLEGESPYAVAVAGTYGDPIDYVLLMD